MYSTDLITREALRTVRGHDKEAPLFLYLPYQAVHAPLEAPRDEFSKIKKTGNSVRDIYRAMLSRLDGGVRKIVKELRRQGMWSNTILVFSTDNGGAVSQAGSNHPLRGTKGTLFEGGTHGVGFVAGGALSRTKTVVEDLFHITDWYPTLLTAAGGSHLLDKDLDGINQWDVLDKGAATNRTEMVYNLKSTMGAIRVGPYKLMFARNFTKDNWYDIDSVSLATRKTNNQIALSKTRVFLKDPSYAENIFKITMADENDEDDEDEEDQEDNEILDAENDYQKLFDKKWPSYQKHLFNIDEDPEERLDLQESQPQILEELRRRVRQLYGSFVPADFPAVDHRGSPKHFQGVWSPGWC